MKLRPLAGRFWIARSLTTEVTAVRLVSISGAAAVTVTLSAMLGLSVILTVDAC